MQNRSAEDGTPLLRGVQRINQRRLIFDLMKTLCICWGLAAAIVLLWQRVPSFEQRVCPLALQPPVSMMELPMRPPSFSRSATSAPSLKSIIDIYLITASW
jgi:hypothetical protein